ncbi:MAG TPA: DUF3365 domain-containing protein, partial [Pirellulaceae bacterium]|nr:DUF3365 domain-containing protein [Pirellulaceae bacterium]
MTRSSNWWQLTILAILGGVFAAAAILPTTAEDKKDDPALARARKTVLMLDDIYKTTVVLITEHYVTDDSSLAAGEAAQALFGAIKKKGWHEVRLIDAAGEPIVDGNRPKDDFEKAAVAALKSGKSGYEQVIEKDGKRYLRSATPIPVVHKKCVMCHDNYKLAKEGEPIGALGYTIP